METKFEVFGQKMDSSGDFSWHCLTVKDCLYDALVFCRSHYPDPLFERLRTDPRAEVVVYPKDDPDMVIFRVSERL